MPASGVTADDWRAAYDIPLIVNMQPAGKYLGERFHRAGGAPPCCGSCCRTAACTARRPDRHRQDDGAEPGRPRDQRPRR
ncbi:hypothetical protein ACRAWD_28060 [Caulobacter segnis]